MTNLNPFFGAVLGVKNIIAYISSLKWFFNSAEGATQANDMLEGDLEFERWLESSQGITPESNSWLSEVMKRQTGKENEGWDSQFK